MRRIKAAGFLGTREYFIEKYGQAALKKVMDSMADADRDNFSKAIVPVSWVDHGAYIRYLLAADKVLGTGNMELAKEAVRYEVRRNFHGIYKFFLRITTVEFLIVQGANLYRQFHDTGKATAKIIYPGKVNIVITDYPDVPLLHEIDTDASMEELGKLCGGKSVISRHVQCMARGDSQCVFEITVE